MVFFRKSIPPIRKDDFQNSGVVCRALSAAARFLQTYGTSRPTPLDIQIKCSQTEHCVKSRLRATLPYSSDHQIERFGKIILFTISHISIQSNFLYPGLYFFIFFHLYFWNHSKIKSCFFLIFSIIFECSRCKFVINFEWRILSRDFNWK